MFEALPDVVVVVDSTLVIRYVNPFARRLTGHGDEVLGHNMVEFIHPDDTDRAAEVAGLILTGTLGAEVTPARYRLRRADGSWITVELTATPPVSVGTDESRILVMGRYCGDTDLLNQIFAMLTEGRPSDAIIDVLPQFGTWRYPDAHYMVSYPTSNQGWRQSGSAVAIDLVTRYTGPDTPWGLAPFQPEIVHDLDDLRPDLREAALAHGLYGCMVIPVGRSAVVDSGEPAFAVAWSPDPNQSVCAHRYALDQMAGALDLVLQWRNHLTALEGAARIDSLSGVANRATFIDAFEEALATSTVTGTSLAVLYVDLDEFKYVNDRFGHAVGDAVIVAAAERMRTVVRRDDLIGRIGGDEFAVLCQGITDQSEVTSLAERIVATLAEPFEHEGTAMTVGASVGVTFAGPDTSDHHQLLAIADRALYRAKAEGRGTWRLG